MDLEKTSDGKIRYSDILAYAQITGLPPAELMVKIHALEDAYGDNSSGTDSGN